ncbi:MAG: porphobilinogen synthase [Candidatus Puniceispirillum sp.]|nr:porphobilinogen synthase [Candidatus Puniceispirillum sp.]
MVSASFPNTRLRRNRRYNWLRDLVAETSVSPKDLVWPLFIRDKGTSATVPSLPGVRRYLVEELQDAVSLAQEAGVTALMLFPVVEQHLKDAKASQSLNPEGLVLNATRALAHLAPNMGIMVDLALDPFTDHGHDGFYHEGDVLNDATVEHLCQVALLQAEAGAHMIAPSDMMDGRIGAIRKTLDGAGYNHVGILAYAAKYASSLYGPFRDIVDSSGCLKGGSKATYQMDPRNGNEAMREVAQDIAQGADAVMVKPGSLYLDIVYRVKSTFQIPTFAYHVSGEYAMLKAAAAAGYLDEPAVLLETLTAFKRAGADAIITYSALEAGHFLQEALS